MTFFQRLGGVLGVSIAGTIFSNQLPHNLARYASNVPSEVVQSSVAVRVIHELEMNILIITVKNLGNQVSAFGTAAWRSTCV
jgi:hypothetical protein